MAHHCALPRCQDSREPPSVPAKPHVPYRVNPAVEPVKSPSPDPLRDGVPAQSRRYELPSSDDTMLSGRHPRDDQID